LLESEAEVEHWVVSDGLASVSIYLEKAIDKAEQFEGATQMGAISVFGAVIDGAQVTVIGDVPGETVEAIARSVVHVTGTPGD
jgi:sigma-E factor negative regulatory protein RseB